MNPAIPQLGELLQSAHVVSLPLRMPFRGITHREAMLLPGPQGWAEFAPFREYGDDEAATWLRAALDAGWAEPVPAVRSAIEVNATVPAVPADQVGAVLDAFPSCTTAKVKVAQRGQQLSDDLARVSAVRDRLGATGKIRVDANGAWDLDQARHALGELSAYDLEYAEQPVARVEDLVRLRVALAAGGIEVPIAADESIRRAGDPMLVARSGAADLIVVKVAPLGGVRRALQIVSDCGLPAVVSSALDTSVGIAQGVALACALPALSHACGLGTLALFAADVADPSLVPVDGRLRRGDAHTTTQNLDPELLRRHRSDEQTRRWWRDRLERCWQFT
ncbi:MAG: o-succinylbenzoate synthase [Ornithinimicrobium sp.]